MSAGYLGTATLAAVLPCLAVLAWLSSLRPWPILFSGLVDVNIISSPTVSRKAAVCGTPRARSGDMHQTSGSRIDREIPNIQDYFWVSLRDNYDIAGSTAPDTCVQCT